MRAVAGRGGVVGVSSVLLGDPSEDGATAAAFADQVAYIADLIGIDHVGLGFDFFDFIYRAMTPKERAAFEQHLTSVHLPADLLDHGDAPTVTRLLIERGFDDADVAKVLRDNWLRVLRSAEETRRTRRGRAGVMRLESPGSSLTRRCTSTAAAPPCRDSIPTMSISSHSSLTFREGGRTPPETHLPAPLRRAVER